MKVKSFEFNPAIIRTSLSMQRSGIQLCTALLEQLNMEIDILEKGEALQKEQETDCQAADSALQTSDQRTTQVLNMLAIVIKNMNELHQSIVRGLN